MKDKIKALDSIFRGNNYLSLDNKLVTFINGYSYLLVREKSFLSHFDLLGLDGLALKFAFGILVSKVNRLSFDMTSLAPFVFQGCIENRRNIYFIGSTEHSIKRFVGVISTRYPELDILGFRHGYFGSCEEKFSFIEELVKINPSVLVVGMGTPLQEQFLLEMRNAGWLGAGFSCGGFIHQTVKRLNYYPKWVQKTGVRWAYRIYKEPKVIKRLIYHYPAGLFFFAVDILNIKRRR